MSGFEGSFLGETTRLDPSSALECGVCWWVYDPTLGDEVWQIPAGTAFAELPTHWRCPNCDNPPEQFMVLRREGAAANATNHPRPAHPAGLQTIRQREQDLLRIHIAIGERMRPLPVYNDSLNIQVIGLHRWTEGLLGTLATPWCMNIILIPPADGPRRTEGTSREIGFPSGTYLFTAGHLEGIGTIESCSLFSPMEEFDDPEVVRQVAQHALDALLELPAEAAPPQGLSRRRLLRGGGKRAP